MFISTVRSVYTKTAMQPCLNIAYTLPPNASHGVRKQLRLLRTHLGPYFRLKLVGVNGPAVGFDVWLLIVQNMMQNPPSRTGIQAIMTLAAASIRDEAAGRGSERADVFHDYEGYLERAITRHHFETEHSRSRYQRRLGTARDVRTIYKHINDEFVGLSMEALDLLQAKSDANRRVVESQEEAAYREGIVDPWPWWLFRFLSNWWLVMIQSPDESWRPLKPAIRTNRRRVPTEHTLNYVIQPNPMNAGADLAVIDVGKWFDYIRPDYTKGDHTALSLRLTQLPSRPLMEVTIAGIREFEAPITEMHFHGDRIFLRKLLVDKLTSLSLHSSIVGWNKLDLGKAVVLDSLTLFETPLQDLRLPCRSLNRLELYRSKGQPWKIFEGPGCFNGLGVLKLEPARVTPNFLKSLEFMTPSLREVSITDLVGEWRALVETMNRTTRTWGTIYLSLHYDKQSLPEEPGTKITEGIVEVSFFEKPRRL